MKSEFRDDGKPRVPPGQHEVDSFPVLQKGKIAHVTRDNYELEIAGEIKNPKVLSLQELNQLEDKIIHVDIHCVTSWSKLETQWTGISFTTLIDIVEPKSSAQFVEFLCADDNFTTSVPINKIKTPDAILALRYDGLPLGDKHGGPVRAVIPDLYFYKSAKWIKKITFLKKDRLGYWERGGYSNKADPWKEQRYRSDDEK
ncbi:MAG: sulfite oxidase-like oxidoreductase [Promethearchaeota archaeon]|nr:MAG: sulfite oxidase-like oxidoreductase [Candidatus Lokiarchaeota archaeon]